MVNYNIIRQAKRAWIFALMMLLATSMAIIWIFTQNIIPNNHISIVVKQNNLRILPPKKIRSHTVAKLEARFRTIGYDLNDIRNKNKDVPRISADSIPYDMSNIEIVSRKKDLFIGMMLPLVLIANERLMMERKKLLAIIANKKSNGKINIIQQQWLDKKFTNYKVKNKSIDILLKRLDMVPPSLALAQAAIESGWGTSRFAREGNALYGQWTWDGDGIVPKTRDAKKTHKIKSFKTPLDSVNAYIKNLNTHQAYNKLRQLRQTARQNLKPVDGSYLAIALTAYSEKGMEYVNLIRLIIKANGLKSFDNTKLARPNNITAG